MKWGNRGDGNNDDVLDVYSITMYVTLPRVTTEELQREKRAALLNRTKSNNNEEKGDAAAKQAGEESSDEAERRRLVVLAQMSAAMGDNSAVRQFMPHSLSDEEHCFPIAGSPVLHMNRHLPDGPVIVVTADGRVGLSDEDRLDKVVLGSNVLWQWNADQGWVDFDKEHNRLIEREYEKDPGSSATFNVFGIGVFVVNFRSMQQRNTQNGATRPVRRHQRVDGNRVEPDVPVLVTVSVSVPDRSMRTYVNGLLSGEYRLRDPRRFALDTAHPIVLFGHREQTRVAGGAVQWLTLTPSTCDDEMAMGMYDEMRVFTEWLCTYCSCRNKDGATNCSVCEMPRAKQSAATASTEGGGGGGSESHWICACTNVNAGSDAACTFCQLPKGATLF